MEKNITWIIKNGHNVRFWKDPLVPHVGSLEDHVQGFLPTGEWEFSVSSCVGDMGWQWNRFQSLLSDKICGKIASLRPPSWGEEDFPCWNHTVMVYSL